MTADIERYFNEGMAAAEKNHPNRVEPPDLDDKEKEWWLNGYELGMHRKEKELSKDNLIKGRLYILPARYGSDPTCSDFTCYVYPVQRSQYSDGWDAYTVKTSSWCTDFEGYDYFSDQNLVRYRLATDAERQDLIDRLSNCEEIKLLNLLKKEQS